MKKFIILLLVSIVSVYAANFSKSKKVLLKQIYPDHQITFYCGNPYEITRVGGKEKSLIIEDSKYYSPRKPFTKSGKENERAKRIEWEHVMPVPFIFSKYGQEKSLKLYVVKS